MSSNFKYINKLQNKHILIFGGTSGIGFGVAEACIEQGAHLTLTSSSQSNLDAAVHRLQTSYPDHPSSKLHTATCDLSTLPTLSANLLTLLNTVTNNGTFPINHIVFTAGDSLPLKPLSDIDAAYVSASFALRFTAPLLLAAHLPNFMPASPDSSLTLTGGINSHKPRRGWTLPASVGSAIEGLTRGLAVDLAPRRVNCVAPGAIATELFTKNGIEEGGEVWEGFRRASTVGKVGRVEDVVEAYLWGMRDGFGSGTVVHSSGGGLLVGW
ncbi:hypothetical protein LTS18_008264 [Coniosporium uncinatum]|uniref:Uncharacterized protein n=1 Tax=Coniosporium uncinatum TaxID=93489 RepID=A0ACC3DX86_9PEZI|nr:hypothetical protein LTS18_008264 [Coniosporium uncinatum]